MKEEQDKQLPTPEEYIDENYTSDSDEGILHLVKGYAKEVVEYTLKQAGLASDSKHSEKTILSLRNDIINTLKL